MVNQHLRKVNKERKGHENQFDLCLYQLLEKWVAHEQGARTCTRFPQGCIYYWEMSQHAIGANTPHPLLTALLLLWAEPSFPSMCNSAEPKQSVKAHVLNHLSGHCKMAAGSGLGTRLATYLLHSPSGLVQ